MLQSTGHWKVAFSPSKLFSLPRPLSSIPPARCKDSLVVSASASAFFLRRLLGVPLLFPSSSWISKLVAALLTRPSDPVPLGPALHPLSMP
jgi:hypothetical protein